MESINKYKYYLVIQFKHLGLWRDECKYQTNSAYKPFDSAYKEDIAAYTDQWLAGTLPDCEAIRTVKRRIKVTDNS